MAMTNEKTKASEIAEVLARLVNPYSGMSMNSKPFRIFRNVKKNKRVAAKRRNVLRERVKHKSKI